MGKQRELYKRWKEARLTLGAIFNPADHSVVIHYSCESFYGRENNPRSPRVTSIAIRNLASGQTRSFSIHLLAERHGLLDSIEDHFDRLEREMLDEFYQAVREKQHCRWVHWNMRDANFGFEALDNRMRALGGIPAPVPEDHRVDLSRLLIDIYGHGYIGHPRIEKLMQLNKVVARDFLNGQEEADAFDRREFIRLHQSTLRKVDVLANFAGKAQFNSLRTQSSWWEQNGKSVKAAAEFLREHWLVAAIVTAAGAAAKIFHAWKMLH